VSVNRIPNINQDICIHDDASPVLFDFSKSSPHSIKKEQLEKLFDELKTDFNNATWLARNADVVFKCASTQLQRTTAICIIAALLAAMGGIGAALCPRQYKKTRWAFALLAIGSAALSIIASFNLYKMYVSASHYQSFFERRWNY
jgi:hypothetical protein